MDSAFVDRMSAADRPERGGVLLLRDTRTEQLSPYAATRRRYRSRPISAGWRPSMPSVTAIPPPVPYPTAKGGDTVPVAADSAQAKRATSSRYIINLTAGPTKPTIFDLWKNMDTECGAAYAIDGTKSTSACGAMS